MKREDVRRLKKEVQEKSDQEAILLLLRRSVKFGHRRLALVRCIQAEQLGASVAPELLAYCRQIADQMSESDLSSIVSNARRQCGTSKPPKEYTHG